MPDNDQATEVKHTETHDTSGAHNPFFHVPFINPRSLHFLDEAIISAERNKKWPKYLEEAYEKALQDLGSIDHLANLARKMMLGDSVSQNLFLQNLSPYRSQLKNRGNDVPIHSHQTSTPVSPDLVLTQGSQQLEPQEHQNQHVSRSIQLTSDDPRFHLFQTGSLIDVLLGIAYATISDPTIQKSLLETLNNLIVPAASALSNLVQSASYDQEINAFPQAARAALSGYLEYSECSPTATVDPIRLLLDSRNTVQSLGPTFIHISSLLILLRDISLFWEKQNPIHVWAAAIEETEENNKPFKVTPETAWAGENQVALIPEDSCFNPGAMSNLAVYIQGRKCPIRDWQSACIRVSVPLGARSGGLYFSKTLTEKSLMEVNQAQHAIIDFFPHGLAGSIFENFSISNLAPPPPVGAKQVTVKHRPILQRLELVDGKGQLIADTGRSVNLKQPQRPIKVRWNFAPMDNPDASITLLDGEIPIGEGLDLAGELALPDHILENIRVRVPWDVPDFVLSFPILTIDMPSSACLPANGDFISLHIRLRSAIRVDLTIEIDWESSLELLPGIGFPILPAGQRDIVVFVRRRPDIRHRGSFTATVRFNYPVTGEGSGFQTRLIDFYLEEPMGRWDLVSRLDVVAIHAALMQTGHVLFFGFDDAENHNTSRGEYQLWDAELRGTTGEIQKLAITNPFCCGHSLLEDGRLFMAGGHAPGQRGGDIADLFDQNHSSGATEHVHIASLAIDTREPRPRHAVRIDWTSFSRMEGGRWYPTCITLPSGKVLTIGGSLPLAAYIVYTPVPIPIPLSNPDWQRLNTRYLIFNPTSGLMERPFDHYPTDDRVRDHEGRNIQDDGKRMAGLYSLMHVLPTVNIHRPSDPDSSAPEGNLFILTESFVRLYNPSTNEILRGSKTDIGGFRTWPTQGSSVLLPIDITEEGDAPLTVRIMVVGGGERGQKDNDEGRDDALAEALILNYEVDTQRFTRAGRDVDIRRIRLHRPRFMGDSILLPDGNILVVNGAARGYTNDNSDRIRQPEIIDPVAGTSTIMEEARIERGYHSTALLLPDGAIVVAGSTGGWPPNEQRFEVEIFEPPYLSCGPKPRILGELSDSVIRYRQPFEVESEGLDVIEQIVLIRCGSTTHSLNTDQRLLRFRATRAEGNPFRLRARMPGNRTYAPPGFYMLFIFSLQGTPSKAKFVKVGP